MKKSRCVLWAGASYEPGNAVCGKTCIRMCSIMPLYLILIELVYDGILVIV